MLQACFSRAGIKRRYSKLSVRHLLGQRNFLTQGLAYLAHPACRQDGLAQLWQNGALYACGLYRFSF